jgi:Rod binding domain-containing protein
MSAGIPPIDRAMLPADVRNGSPERRQAYEAGLGFERMLVAQLAKSLADTTGGNDDSASAATKTYTDMLPDALADGIVAGGGLGLARHLLGPLEETTK